MPSSRGTQPTSQPEGSGSAGIEAKAIERARHGDGDAIQFLYARYADVLFHHVQELVVEPTEAEAVVHEVFARLATSIRLYPTDAVEFADWILETARETAVEHLSDSG